MGLILCNINIHWPWRKWTYGGLKHRECQRCFKYQWYDGGWK